MNAVKSPIRLIWHRSKTRSRSQTASYILQLPIEILIKIFTFLPPYSQLLLYQTCRPLRTIIYQHFLQRGEILVTLKDRLHYLTHLARSLPDRWVCAKCCKLHQTCSWDTPSSRAPECGDGRTYDFNDYSISKGFFNDEYSPAHRHVELTLKYTRLKSQERVHQKHLQRLLTPHHATSQRPHDIDVAEGILAQRSFYPKVVDGRYLLLTIWTYLAVKTKTIISRQSIQSITICPHLSSFADIRLWNGLKLTLDMIVYSAFSAPPNTRAYYPCLACKIDVCIQISPERAMICTWKDLGPEGTVYDPDWEAIDHVSGSIRELYGLHEHNGEIL